MAGFGTESYILRSMPLATTVLVIRFGSLGDVILTTPLLRAIATANPSVRITYVTKAAYRAVVMQNPYVRQVVTLEPGMSVRPLAARLARTRWDHRLDLHGSPRSHALRWLLGGRWGTYRKQRVRRTLLITMKRSRARGSGPVAERYFEAARALGAVPDGAAPEVFTAPGDQSRARQIVEGDYVVLAPGAAHATKRWPPHHWQQLATRLQGSGRRVVGVGLAHERACLAGAPVIDAFATDLGVTSALLRDAQAVVANDSGLMHLATAVGTPVIALFGPTVEAFGFFPYRSKAVVLERSLSCRPCSRFGGTHCPLGHHRCMIDISPAEVHAALSAA